MCVCCKCPTVQLIESEIIPKIISGREWRTDESFSNVSDQSIRCLLGAYGLEWKTIYDTGFVSRASGKMAALKYKIKLINIK